MSMLTSTIIEGYTFTQSNLKDKEKSENYAYNKYIKNI